MFNRSILRGAKYNRGISPARRFYSSHETRPTDATLASPEPKQRQKRTRKKLKDLPSTFMLPDGTPAKPLGDWRAVNLFKEPSSSCTVSAGDTQSRVNTGQDASEDTTLRRDTPEIVPMPVTPDAPKAPRKRRRSTKKLTATSDAGEDDEGSPSGGPRTILAQEIYENLSKFPHCLLLTRVGQFYESYFEQAEEIANLLNIKLTSRKWGGSRVPMCGFPLIHLDKHLKVLVQQHKRFVAMCEEFPLKELFGTKQFERRVARIITPGTLIDEPFLDAHENNFLLAISSPSLPQQSDKNGEIGLAWIDISTGEFYSKHITMESVQDELARISPREVVLPDAFKDLKNHRLMDALEEENCFLSFIASNQSHPTDNATDAQYLHQSELTHHRISLSSMEQAAIDILTSYLNVHLLENMPPLAEPIQDNVGHMQIDAHTIKALEIRETNYEGGTRGSLFSVLKRTVTNGGARLLSRWLCSPSTSLADIAARQSLVEFFLRRPHLEADLSQLLTKVDDTSRLTQKCLAGRSGPSDLIAIGRTIHTWLKISSMLDTEKDLEKKEQLNYSPQEWRSLEALMSRLHTLTDLLEAIDKALGIDDETVDRNLEELPFEGEGEMDNGNPKLAYWKLPTNRGFVRPESSKTLQRLYKKFQGLLVEKDALEKQFQNDFGAPSLTLRASPAQGMHVHLSRKRDQPKLNNDANFIPTYESGSTKCFFNPDWSQLGNRIVDIMERLALEEKEVFNSLRNMVNEYSFSLKRNSDIINELDVALSFSKVANELKFVKPTITNDDVYDVVNGRHPSVETGLLTSGRVFTPNSIKLDPDSKVHIITGPNMAGKSTFLRQIALISILAQIGSFVPAESATIGIVDRLFSRIGAKDDLFRDRSTFMVEMLETADILRRATDKSLVIMDEVGRGTTVRDGLAIAFATVHHLTTVNRSRTLFATHFHELAHMLGHTDEAMGSGIYTKLRFYCTDIDETEDGYFSYSYRLRPGVNWDSHGIKVAQLAGLPHTAIETATNTLKSLQ